MNDTLTPLAPPQTPVAAPPVPGRPLGRWVGLALALAALAAGGWGWAHRSVPATDVLRVSGTVEAVTAELGFRQPGRVWRRQASEGDAVKAGQLLAELEPTPLADQLAQRAADVHAARAGLTDLQAGARPAEIVQAQANAQRARAALAELEAGTRASDLAAARAVLARATIQAAQLDTQAARAERLFAVGGLSALARDGQVAAARGADASRAEARARLQLLVEGPRTEELEQARAQALQAAAAASLSRQGARAGQLDQAQARLELARAAYAGARTQLGDARLVAPFAGVVLAQYVEPGEIVAAGTPVVTLGRLADTYVEAYVPEDELARVRPGERATITIDGAPGRTFPGRVTFVSDQAEFTPKSVQTEKERVKLVYRIKIAVPNERFSLKPGMPADAAIATGSAP